MRRHTYLWLAMLMATVGIAFSGYLSGVQWLSGVCSPTPLRSFFLGYPACYTGFILFTAMLLAAATALVARVKSSWPVAANVAVSAVGVAFAGRLTFVELMTNHSPSAYSADLRSSAYGLAFFGAVFGVSCVARWRSTTKVQARSPRPRVAPSLEPLAEARARHLRIARNPCVEPRAHGNPCGVEQPILLRRRDILRAPHVPVSLGLPLSATEINHALRSLLTTADTTRRLSTLARRAAALDVGAFVTAPAERIRAKLVPGVRQVAHEVISVLTEVVDVAQADDPALADLSFMAASELRHLEHELDSASDHHDQLLIACEQLRRRVVAAVTAFERSASPSSAALPSVDRAELDKAIAIRAAYARFRQSLPRLTGQDPFAVRHDIHAASLALATLAAEPAFRGARLSDRLLIKSLRMRAAECDLGGNDLAPARGLLSDLAACAELLRGVNRRQELVAHDRELLERLRGVIDGAMSPEALGAALAPLCGRDDDLDDRLRRLARDGHSDALRALLERLLCELNH